MRLRASFFNRHGVPAETWFKWAQLRLATLQKCHPILRVLTLSLRNRSVSSLMILERRSAIDFQKWARPNPLLPSYVRAHNGYYVRPNVDHDCFIDRHKVSKCLQVFKVGFLSKSHYSNPSRAVISSDRNKAFAMSTPSSNVARIWLIKNESFL